MDTREFARFEDAGLVKLSLGPLTAQAFVCFAEEWIDGLTLECFVKDQQDLVTASFLLAYVKGLCSALSALPHLHLKHDDLHAGPRRPPKVPHLWPPQNPPP